MRIDNHMAGFRPPPPKAKNKGMVGLELDSSSLLSSLSSRSTKPDGNMEQEGDEFTRDSARHKVHQRNKIEKAAFILATRGAL